MARVHAAAARSCGADLVTVAASSPDSSRRAAALLRTRDADDSAAALIARTDLDVVHVCTPNATHAPLVREALAAGRHVVCEKPLATDAATAAELTDAAADAGVVAAVPFVYRYHPMVREARARVADGRAGALLSLEGSYLQDWMLSPDDDNWRADARAGGPSRAFADVGSHLCDLVEFVTGECIVRVSAATRRVFERRADRAVANEDIAAVLVQLDSGALGTLLVSQMAPGRKNALVLELHGADSSIRFAQERPEELWIGARAGSQLLQRDPETAAPSAARIQSLPAGHPLGYQDAFTAFVADVYAAIDGAAPDGMPVFEDGRRAAVVTDAILASAASGTWTEVPA